MHKFSSDNFSILSGLQDLSPRFVGLRYLDIGSLFIIIERVLLIDYNCNLL